MKLIELTQNKSVIVDNEDFEALNKFKWHFNQKGPKKPERLSLKRITLRDLGGSYLYFMLRNSKTTYDPN